MADLTRRYFKGLSRNTFPLALSSLFADISTEMLYPVLPIFPTQVLQAGGSIVGLVDGFAQARGSPVAPHLNCTDQQDNRQQREQ